MFSLDGVFLLLDSQRVETALGRATANIKLKARELLRALQILDGCLRVPRCLHKVKRSTALDKMTIETALVVLSWYLHIQCFWCFCAGNFESLHQFWRASVACLLAYCMLPIKTWGQLTNGPSIPPPRHEEQCPEHVCSPTFLQDELRYCQGHEIINFMVTYPPSPNQLLGCVLQVKNVR